MKMGLGLTGEPGRAWVGAWVHGSVHGLVDGWVHGWWWWCDDGVGGGFKSTMVNIYLGMRTNLPHYDPCTAWHARQPQPHFHLHPIYMEQDYTILVLCIEIKSSSLQNTLKQA